MRLHPRALIVIASVASAFASFGVAFAKAADDFVLAVHDAGSAFINYAQRWLETAIETISDSRAAFALETPTFDFDRQPGMPLDAALQNKIRHESRTSRIGAARHI